MKHIPISNKKLSAFTVVELLVVIVVIGLLASITIITYSGVQERAKEVSLKSDLQQANTFLETNRIRNNGYPLTISGATKSEGTNFEYTSNGITYCLTASSAEAGVNTFHTTNAGKILSGPCAGHSG